MERVQYIAARRARFNAICGPVNIPYGTTVEAVDGFLERDGLRLCAATSESAHKYFARDIDGHGLERGKLTAAIIAAVSKRDKGHGERWAKLWADPMACRYRRADHADFWVWSHDFFEANVEDLRHIRKETGQAVGRHGGQVPLWPGGCAGRGAGGWPALPADGGGMTGTVVKAAEKITKAGPRSSTVANAVGALVAAGVIDTPDYWLANYSTFPSLDALLCAMGGAVK